MLEIGTNYSGYIDVSADDPRLAAFYADKTQNHFNLVENQYLVIRGADGEPVDRYKWQDNKHKPIYRKPLESSTLGKVRTKNIEQEFAVDMLMDDSTTVKVMSGGFGSGKTFLGCAAAFHLIQSGKFDKIMWVRNNIEVKDSNPIGYLKGTFQDKMTVWAMPLADHIGGREMLDMLVQKGQIEVEHLGFLRGRDIKHTIIFVS